MLEACMNTLFQNGHILVFFCLLANFIALVRTRQQELICKKTKETKKLMVAVFK